jgi:hypothetical protein
MAFVSDRTGVPSSSLLMVSRFRGLENSAGIRKHSGSLMTIKVRIAEDFVYFISTSTAYTVGTPVGWSVALQNFDSASLVSSVVESRLSCQSVSSTLHSIHACTHIIPSQPFNQYNSQSL